jgi:LysR family transcriptional regulator (chromosome initiation inhibitor)
MHVDPAQLRALLAVVDEGTFDAAATALRVTPSAVSQRIKALERTTGRVLLVRSKPVVVTEPGQSVLRFARQLEILTADAARELGAEEGGAPVTLAVAVNADSLSTWLMPSLSGLRGRVLLDLHRADQDLTASLLRAGTVVAAVTAAATPVPGCTSSRLGVMRYRPAATPDFVAEHFPDGVAAAALARAPVVHFDRDDDLQRGWLRRRTRGRADPPGHHVPSTEAFVQAVRAGLGWGMLSEVQLAELPASAVALLEPRAVVDVPLYWQRWRLRSPSLDLLTDVVVTAARAALRPG